MNDRISGQEGGAGSRQRRRRRRGQPTQGQGQAGQGQARSARARSRAVAAARKQSSGGQQRPRKVSKPARAGSRPGGLASAPHMPTSVEVSAGGLVVSNVAESVRANGRVDLSQIYVCLIGRIDRRGRLLWSMPKGHVEEGEDFHSTAEREVWEETGIIGHVFKDLGVIDYWFVSEGTRIHKTVHHHLLEFVDGQLNDQDPEVSEVMWVPADQLVEKLAYSDERKLARKAQEMLPELARAAARAGKRTPR